MNNRFLEFTTLNRQTNALQKAYIDVSRVAAIKHYEKDSSFVLIDGNWILILEDVNILKEKINLHSFTRTKRN